MSEATRMELVKAVSAIVMENAHSDEPTTLWHGMSKVPLRKLGESEALCRLWGYAYGVTAGLAVRDFGGLPDDERAALVTGVAAEVFQGTALIDLELIRLLENGRMDEDGLTKETLEAIRGGLTQMEGAA